MNKDDFQIRVQIADPNTPDGMCSTMTLDMKASFSCNPNDYGNGYHVKIDDGHGFGNYYDLRYDKTFRKDRKEEWLLSWAKDYWSGKNGAYELTFFQIK